MIEVLVSTFDVYFAFLLIEVLVLMYLFFGDCLLIDQDMEIPVSLFS